MFEEFFSEFTLQIVVGTILITGGSVFAYFRSLKNCQRETTTKVDKLSKRSFRQSQAILTMASVLDKQTNRLHSDEKSTLLSDVERALRDEKGDL